MLLAVGVLWIGPLWGRGTKPLCAMGEPVAAPHILKQSERAALLPRDFPPSVGPRPRCSQHTLLRGQPGPAGAVSEWLVMGPKALGDHLLEKNSI